MNRNTLIYKHLYTDKDIRCYLKNFKQNYKTDS